VLRRRHRDPGATERTAGPPTSSNGASSMHLWWTPPAGRRPLTTVSAVLEVVEPPTVDRLHFWALQATFVDRSGRPFGAAHLGLQWHPGHPGGTAVNWGGYRSDGSGELDAHAPSTLPSATGNVNTRDYPWRARTPYRLSIDGDGSGSVTDLASGETTVVRRLDVGGAVALASPVVWSEVFARCDDPSSAVRWSELTPPPTTTQVTYQSFEDGGCTNTLTEVVDHGAAFVQRTNVVRVR
jgi:hypothetical protein